MEIGACAVDDRSALVLVAASWNQNPRSSWRMSYEGRYNRQCHSQSHVTHTQTHTTSTHNHTPVRPVSGSSDHRHTRATNPGTHPHVHKTCEVQAWRAPLSALAEQNHGPWPPAYSAASTARKGGSPDGVPNLAVISRPGLEPAWWGSGPGGALGVGLGVRVEGYLRPGGGLGVGLGVRGESYLRPDAALPLRRRARAPG